MSLSSRFLATSMAGAALLPLPVAGQQHHEQRQEETVAEDARGPGTMAMCGQMMGRMMAMMQAQAGKQSGMGVRGGGMMGGGMTARGDMGIGTMGMMGHGMMAGAAGMPMGPIGPAMLLRQREALELDDAQVARLEELKQQLDGLRESHMAEMRPLMEATSAEVRSGTPDIERYESLLRDAASAHVRMRVEAARVSRDAISVLSEEQRSNVRFGTRMRMMREMMHGRMKEGMSGGAH